MRPWEADPQWLAWSNHAMAIGQAFWRALAGRERALLDALGDGPGRSHLLQPGLFDARAERTHRAHAERQLEAETTGRARLAAVERERIATSRPRAVLVLIP
jgi:hypothetical protein